MMTYAGFEARFVWAFLNPSKESVLEAPAVTDYDGMLEGMEAAQLLALLEKVRERLKYTVTEAQEPVKLFIDKQFSIRIDNPEGRVLPLRPLVKSLFILFLRHPEGILLKRREHYRQELEEIYAVISPGTSKENVRARIGRLVNLQDNSFSEKTSVLNARLEEFLPKGAVESCKIQGYNGHPRKIPLNPLFVHWESK